MYRRQQTTNPKKQKSKKATWSSKGDLQMAEERRDVKSKKKGKIHPTKCRVPKNSVDRREELPQ